MARKKFSSEFKASVAFELIKGELTISEIASKHNIHPTQIKDWKAILANQAKTLFEKPKKQEEDTTKGYIEALERKAGRLTIEIDFLKKNLDRYSIGND